MATATKARTPRTTRASKHAPSAKSEATRRRILDSAATLFAAGGYNGTLLSEIAQKANVHVTALSYYFASKEALAEALMNDTVEQVSTAMTAALKALPPKAGLRDKLTAAIESRLRVNVSEVPYMAAHSKVLYQVPAEVRERHMVLLRKDLAVWRKLIKDAADGGEIRRELDPVLTAMFTAGAVNWTIEWLKLGPQSPEAVARMFAEIILDGVGKT
jgi:AcrR family transcriptional regulator